MPLTGEEKNEYNKQYNIRKREQKKQLDAEIADAALSADRDADGKRYRSEVRSWKELHQMFHGINENLDEVEEKKQKDKKRTKVKPSVAKILGQKRTFQEWLDIRDKCRKDGFFLGKFILKHDLLTERVHRIIFDQFVKKNFDGVYKENYSLSDVHNAIADHHDTRDKELVLIDSRGALKSTINGVDAVQWLLNVPDIRILILTGEDTLAESFLGQIKGYFTLLDGADPTDCHLLFPEYILRGRAASSGTPMLCPARKHNQKEASLWVNSVTSNLSGWHCDIRKGDDVVTDRNSNTADTRQKLKDKYDGTDSLVDEWGFMDHIGTRYYTDDWYGLRIAAKEDAPFKYFCRGCWTVKDEFKEVPLRELTVDMVVLTFPEKVTGGVLTPKSIPRAWKVLHTLLNKNERSFRNQQLNEPTDALLESDYVITFDQESLIKHSYLSSSAPKVGDIYVAWDWAYTDSRNSDYSAGTVGRIYQRVEDGEWGISVLEVDYGKWKPEELAFHIVMLNRKWNPKKTLIEKTNCADLLKLEIARKAYQYSTSLDIYWKVPDHGSDAKRNRIKSLQIKLKNDLLWFVNGLWLDETFKQFANYTGDRKNRGRKDDIPDAVSFLAYFCPRRS